jgi:hydroxymethylpyrimidine pyrophosphatase-like HAD family hydrolase
MDNTLTDEFGSSTRPGIKKFLATLKKEGHTLVLWTNSVKQRARWILFEHKLHRYFNTFIYREDYDPYNKGRHKDIRKVNGDILIDDDPGEIAYVKSIKKQGFRVMPYRKGSALHDNDIQELSAFIHKKKKFL